MYNTVQAVQHCTSCTTLYKLYNTVQAVQHCTSWTKLCGLAKTFAQGLIVWKRIQYLYFILSPPWCLFILISSIIFYVKMISWLVENTNPETRVEAPAKESLQPFPLQKVICCFRCPVQSHANTFLNSKEALWLFSVLKIVFPIK